MSTATIFFKSVVSVTIGIAGAIVYAIALAWLLTSVYAVMLRIQHKHCTLFESRRQNVAFEEMTHCAIWWVMLIILPIAGKIISVAYDWLNTIAW